MDTLVEALLDSPLLPRQLGLLNRMMAEERARRDSFYTQMTDEGRWEFINGKVVRHPPATWRAIRCSANLQVLLNAYVDAHDLGYVAGGKLLVSLTRNDYQPDVCFFRKEIAAAFSPDQEHFPAPDLIVEILSPATAHNNRGVKFNDYAAHGVAEYWIVDPAAESVEQYILRDAEFQQTGFWKGEDEVSSGVLSDFRVSSRVFFDEKANFSALTTFVTSAAAR